MNNQTPPQTAIVYISGAGLDPAIWDAVHAKITLPDAVLTHAHNDTTTLASAVQEAIDQIQKLGAAHYIIVAHSLGGVIGVELARKLGDKLAGFIAVSATIPAPGESFVATLPFPQRIIMPTLLKLAGTKPPSAAIRKTLCSDLNDTRAQAIIDTFSPEPRSLYVDTTAEVELPVSNYLYIRTLDDKQLRPNIQSRMAEQLPNRQVVDIASGHMIMVSHPDELATVINEFLRSTSLA